MPSDLTLRDARRGDLSAIVLLEEASFPQPWSRRFFEQEIGATGRLNRVALLGERLAGYCFSMFVLDEMHVNKIAVAGDVRRQRVASRLMADAESFGRAHGVVTLSLEVRRTNHEAIAFYRSLGFAEVYVRPRYYPDGDSAVVMMRRLG